MPEKDSSASMDFLYKIHKVLNFPVAEIIITEPIQESSPTIKGDIRDRTTDADTVHSGGIFGGCKGLCETVHKCPVDRVNLYP